MVNVKDFFLKQFSYLVILSLFNCPSYVFASINGMPQMINLNMQFKAKHKTVKSDLVMPFYQTAELEKKIDNKSMLIEVNPRRGKNLNEVAIEMRFYKSSGSKVFAKKEILAKIGEESMVSIKGITIKVTPVL